MGGIITVRMQRRGMITIPSPLRRQLRMRQGQPMVVRAQGERYIVIEVLPMLTPDDLFERYPVTDAVDVEEWRGAMGDALARRHSDMGGDSNEPD